jgi:hypothetical protein
MADELAPKAIQGNPLKQGSTPNESRVQCGRKIKRIEIGMKQSVGVRSCAQRLIR